MITAIEIENFRGIRSGRLDGLTPLTILTGPNACGKSTVLDALLVAASPTPVGALVQAVQRHPGVLSGAKWLFGDPERTASLIIKTGQDTGWKRQLRWSADCEEEARSQLLKRGARLPFSSVEIIDGSPGLVQTQGPISSSVAFSADDQFEGNLVRRGRSTVPDARLVDPGIPILLHRTFTSVARTGRREEVYGLLSALVPAFERLEILTEDDDTPSLYLTSGGRPVPVGLSGDGVQAFVQLALETAVVANGLVLLEEPEVYQHPRAIWQTARALLANMRRGVQLVLTTHSLELIDALLAEASEDDLRKMSVFNLLLEGGEISNGRRVGEDLAFARQTLENDLR